MITPLAMEASLVVETTLTPMAAAAPTVAIPPLPPPWPVVALLALSVESEEFGELSSVLLCDGALTPTSGPT